MELERWEWRPEEPKRPPIVLDARPVPRRRESVPWPLIALAIGGLGLAGTVGSLVYLVSDPRLFVRAALLIGLALTVVLAVRRR